MQTDPPVITILTNRRARFEYHVLESIEVGIALRGTEVKSIRAGKVNLQEAYAEVSGSQLILRNMHVSPFEKGNIFNHDPLRARVLLAHRKEIRKLAVKTEEKGLTLIPLEVYFLGPHVKILLGVCKGKKLHDKREAIKSRETTRALRREED